MQKEQEREAIYRSIFFCDMDRNLRCARKNTGGGCDH